MSAPDATLPHVTLPAPDPVLRCPRCRTGGALSIAAEAVHCLACGADLPVGEGIPILAADPEDLSAQIAEARRVKPSWYVSEQPAEEASPWRHHLRKRRLYVERVLARELAARGKARGGRLLDLGCGDGNNLTWLSRFADRVYGSDYNVARLVRARARLPAAMLFLGDILDPPLVDNAFDVVFFNHVIEHIHEDKAALAAVRRLLAPDGILVLGTPNEGSWWWQLAYRRAPDILAKTDHVHFYTAETIGAKLRSAGFRIIEVKHLGWGPPDWRLDERIRKHKLVDDLFEIVGRVLLPRQASALYLIATPGNGS